MVPARRRVAAATVATSTNELPQPVIAMCVCHTNGSYVQAVAAGPLAVKGEARPALQAQSSEGRGCVCLLLAIRADKAKAGSRKREHKGNQLRRR